MRRLIAAILAIPTLFNGLAMLVAGPLWYETVPGVTETGPFNPHFVQDIGVAFLVAGLALAARAWRPRYWPAAVAGAGFLAAHALLHLVMIAGGHEPSRRVRPRSPIVAAVGARALFRLPQPRRTSCVVGSRAARCAHLPGVTDTTSAISK